MKLTILLIFTATVLCTAISGRPPAGTHDTQVSSADSPGSLDLPEPYFNDTETASLDSRDSDLDKRAYHSVYFCVDVNWQGYCRSMGGASGACVTLGTDLDDKVSSVGPDPGGYCRFYFDAGCVDNDGCLHFDSTNPGRANLALDSQKVCGRNSPSDKITSFQCWDQ